MARRRYQRGTLEERREKWYVRFLDDVIEKDGTVRRVHRRKYLGQTDKLTKKLALRLLDAVIDEARVNAVDYRPCPTAQFSDFADKWVKEVLTQLKPSTQAAAKSHLKHQLRPAFGKMQLADLNAAVIQKALSEWKLSSKSKHNVVMTLRSMWRTAKAQGYVQTAFPELVLPQINSEEARCFTEDEVRKIIEAAAEPYKTLYMLAAETGLRAGELCGLTWENIDIERGIVFVRQSVWRRKVQSPKSKKALRAVTISGYLAEHLRQQRRTGFLFTSKDGRPLNQFFVVQRKLRPLLDTLGIAPGGLHAFRHAHCSTMGTMGIPVKVAQDRMGHVDARMTLARYTHIPAEYRQVSDKFAEILYPNVTQGTN